MEITPVGFVCFGLCWLIFIRPVRFGLALFAVTLPLAAAAAINLPAVGNLSLLCTYIATAALLAAIATRPAYIAGMINYAYSTPAVMLFGLFALYAALSSYFMPQFFEGSMDVYSFARVADPGQPLPLTSLTPNPGNVSQAAYLVSHFAIFWVLAYFLSFSGGHRRILSMMNIVTAVHLAFAALSAAPANAAVEAVLNFVRTANYEILSHQQIAGLHRLIGSYPEPSSFGAASVTLLAFNFVRYIQTRGVWYGVASISMLACVLISLSTTALATLGVLIILWSLQTSYSVVKSGLKQEDLTSLMVNALVVTMITIFLFFEPARALLAQIYESLFGSKLISASGLERGRWNAQALSNAMQSYGLGVGMGSVRTSSLVVALVSNVGIVGFALYAGFAYSSFLRPAAFRRIAVQGQEALLATRLYAASRAAAIASVIGAAISGGSVNQSMLFYVFAAIATSVFSDPTATQNRRPVLTTSSRTKVPALNA